MDKSLKLELVEKAQKYLMENAQDPMHDITHHKRVVGLVSQLMAAEHLEQQVDPDLVEVLAWWHDVEVPGIEHPAGKRVVVVTAEYLSNLLPEDLRAIAFDSIVNHEFGSAPQYVEGKVLQDADKLEILSEARVDGVIESIRTGKLDRDKMLQTLVHIKSEWLPKMLERYHFQFSRNYHEQKLVEFTAYLDAAEIKIRELKDIQ